MPVVVDNGKWISFRDQAEWDALAWEQMLVGIQMRKIKPEWVAVPDAVGDRSQTLELWDEYCAVVDRFEWPKAFCVQDGMTERDVPEGADVIFVGGTDNWKFRNLRRWTENFPRVHGARVNSVEQIEICERLGCESVDGTGWFRDPSREDKLPAIKRFIEGHRNTHPELSLTKIDA